MGKKTKDLNNTQDGKLPSTNIGKRESEDVNVYSGTHNSTESVKKSKKKNRKRDLNGTIIEDASVQIKSEENNESSTLGNPTTVKIKKEKKKKHTNFHEEELCEKVQNDTGSNKLNEDQLNIARKKKNKGKLLDEDDKVRIETCAEIEDHKQQKKSKEKKKKDSSSMESNVEMVKAPEIRNEDTKQKKKKGKKKAKTGAPVLNNEESQVTEEDIDKFIDELDEEDNKQYEDWVKLLDARLSKKQQTE